VEVMIDPRYCGPAGSANGGYTCGLVAELVGEPAEVTLRRPPPLGRAFRVTRSDGRVELREGDEVVAEGVPAEVELDVPPPVDFETAERAAESYPGFERHAFPTCFVCGPDRAAGDGLRIFASPVPDRDLVAAPWIVPDEVSGRLVWAALDCPGAFAVMFPDRGEVLLGRLAARIDRVPAAGERCVVLGWRLGEDGRKLYAGTALLGERGDACAVARATWIEPRRDSGQV
jgi:hypothetical protein